VPPELIPKPSAYYYKKHADHAGFSAPAAKMAEKKVVDVPQVRIDADASASTS
jgi:hypothetical protein